MEKKTLTRGILKRRSSVSASTIDDQWFLKRTVTLSLSLNVRVGRPVLPKRYIWVGRRAKNLKTIRLTKDDRNGKDAKILEARRNGVIRETRADDKDHFRRRHNSLRKTCIT